jgi:hypothetical protein
MEKYGYKARRQPIVEFESQLRLEHSFAQRKDNNTVQVTAGVGPPAPAPIVHRELLNQTETRTVDGRNRIQPVLIRRWVFVKRNFKNLGVLNCCISMNGDPAVPSSHINRSAGIPCTNLSVQASKHPMNDNECAATSAKRQMLKVADDMVNTQYILPTLVTPSTLPKLLAVPKLHDKIMLSMGSLSIECRNFQLSGLF